MQEICSFLKGSAEALDSPGGKLTLEAYLEVPFFMTPYGDLLCNQAVLEICSVSS